MTLPDFSSLDEAGLNLHAVLSLADMAAELRRALDPEGRFRQLILVGSGGPALWSSMRPQDFASADPIDDYSVRVVERWLDVQAPGCDHAILYPGNEPIDLQLLGELAGWHFASPFMVGINARWGSWFGYRAAVVTMTDFALSPREVGEAPCDACARRRCVDACPAGALVGANYDLLKCVTYRKTGDSQCRETCLARLACPVGRECRYSDAQISHHYTASLRIIEHYF